MQEEPERIKKKLSVFGGFWSCSHLLVLLRQNSSRELLTRDCKIHVFCIQWESCDVTVFDPPFRSLGLLEARPSPSFHWTWSSPKQELFSAPYSFLKAEGNCRVFRCHYNNSDLNWGCWDLETSFLTRPWAGFQGFWEQFMGLCRNQTEFLWAFSP